jgi:hypothetical protein
MRPLRRKCMLFAESRKFYFRIRIKLSQILCAQALGFNHQICHILPKATQRHALTNWRKRFEPFLAARIHFFCAAQIPFTQVIANHGELQNAAIKLAHGRRFFVPGIFEGFVGKPKLFTIEALDAKTGKVG